MGKEKSSDIRRNHYVGCILGGAVGDALGAPIEFWSARQIISVYGPDGITGYVEYPDGTGEITDDTQMTLFTAEGLLRAYHRAIHNGSTNDPVQITWYAYLRWLHTQGYPLKISAPGIMEGWLIKQEELFRLRAPGNTCLGALNSGKYGTVQNPINNSKGCGTVMRIAPAALIYSTDRKSAFRLGADLSALTHGHPSGYLSGGMLAAILFDLLNDISPEKSIENAIAELREWNNHGETLQAVEKALELFQINRHHQLIWETIEQLGSGWVAEEALAISLLCALRYPDDFEKAVLTAVNHSGDSDSTGAITGNIVGLMVGNTGIKEEWKQNLRYGRIMEEIANDLCTQFSGNSFQAHDEWATKYPPY
jgi:ADP-ribosylglycohydrolase